MGSEGSSPCGVQSTCSAPIEAQISLEDLQTLQARRKWYDEQPNIKEGDVILLKDKDTHRNKWPIGIIERPLPGDDGRVRKAIVRVTKAEKQVHYTRPITDMVLLVEGRETSQLQPQDT